MAHHSFPELDEATRQRVRLHVQLAEVSLVPTVVTHGADHRLAFINPAFCRLTGRPRAELDGLALADLCDEGSAPPLVALLEQVAHSRVAGVAVDLALPRAQAQSLYCTLIVSPIPGAPAGRALLVVQAIDTTVQVLSRRRALEAAEEVRQANQALVLAGVREQELAEQASGQTARLRELLRTSEQLAAVVEHASDFIAIATRQGEPLFLNAAAQRLAGLTGPQGVRGHAFHELLAAGDRERFEREALPLALKEGRWSGELAVHHLQGSVQVPLHCVLFTIPEAQTGEVLGVALVGRDVSVLKRQEAEARRRAEFEQQLIGIVSHDLRNPISSILLAASVLRREGGLDERQQGRLAAIEGAARRSSRMVRDLLDFTQARLGSGLPVEPRPLQLHELVDQVVEEVRAAHPGREVRLEHQGDTRGAWDPDRMAQVLTNLLGNALQYSPPASAVTVRVSGHADGVVLAVHNPGEPIPPQVLQRLFEPLQRGAGHGDKQSRSIGLGLYIVDQVVRAHGGSITVESSTGTGTTFIVRLPRGGPEAA